jgi:hypothetical protein
MRVDSIVKQPRSITRVVLWTPSANVCLGRADHLANRAGLLQSRYETPYGFPVRTKQSPVVARRRLAEHGLDPTELV